MFLKPVDLTTALRPSLLQDETLLFVQDAVGLYQGKYKIPSHQKGHVYLTSLRACYVDDDEPRKFSVGFDLKDVGRYEIQAGFLKSSPKIIIYPKPQKRAGVSRGLTTGHAAVKSPTPKHLSPPSSRSASPLRPAPLAAWICPICSYSNSIPSSFDPVTANVPTCLACGVKPSRTTVLKAAIAAASSRATPQAIATPSNPVFTATEQPATPTYGDSTGASTPPSKAMVSCPRCTYSNLALMTYCETCNAPLLSAEALRLPLNDAESWRPESPGPLMMMSGMSLNDDYFSDGLKLSFRAGGEKIFHERLKNAIVQRKWLLQDAPPIPKPIQSTAPPQDNLILGLTSLEPTVPPRPSGVGIAGLERRGLETRKNNEVVIGNAFEDLEALMASAKEVIALAETFAAESGRGPAGETSAVISQSAAALGMITTKDMLGTGSKSENLYLSELSRNLAEYLTDDINGILRQEGGIMSLIDIWAVFNRNRNGVELVSPTDFEKAARLWEKLKLPVRLRRFKSGLLVVQRYDWNDEKTVSQLKQWMEEFRAIPPPKPVAWDWRVFGRGVTTQEAAQRFGWSLGVATEELEMAEDRGALCREESIEGLRFWSNWFFVVEDHIDGGVANAANSRPESS